MAVAILQNLGLKKTRIKHHLMLATSRRVLLFVLLGKGPIPEPYGQIISDPSLFLVAVKWCWRRKDATGAVGSRVARAEGLNSGLELISDALLTSFPGTGLFSLFFQGIRGFANQHS